MDAKHLRRAIRLLRELRSERGEAAEPISSWRVRYRLALIVVRTFRVARDYWKLKARRPDVYIDFLDEGAAPTPAVLKLFDQMIAAHLELHRSLKALRKAHRTPR